MPSKIFARVRWLMVAMGMVLAVLVSPANAQRAEVEIEGFYEALEPYGRWLDHPRYGEVWSPSVDVDWRPYTRGQWVHTEEHGWYWESDEPFGWAVFHYGRWFYDDRLGWLWVPGTEWGPAWVAWRYGESDVGWAPLPPDAVWAGGSLQFSSSYYDAPHFSPAWCFVPIALLTAPRIYRSIVPRHRNVYYVRRTRFSSGYRIGQFGIYNGGLARERWRRATGRALPSRRVFFADRPGERRRRDGAVPVFRPRFTDRPGWRGPANGRRDDDRRGRDERQRGNERTRATPPPIVVPATPPGRPSPDRGGPNRGRDAPFGRSDRDRDRDGDFRRRDRYQRGNERTRTVPPPIVVPATPPARPSPDRGGPNRGRDAPFGRGDRDRGRDEDFRRRDRDQRGNERTRTVPPPRTGGGAPPRREGAPNIRQAPELPIQSAPGRTLQRPAQPQPRPAPPRATPPPARAVAPPPAARVPRQAAPPQGGGRRDAGRGGDADGGRKGRGGGDERR